MIFDQMCQAVSTEIQKIHQHPFNQELAEGTLPNEKFIFYLAQDAMYLSDYSRALAMVAVKLPDTQSMKQFIQFAHGAVSAECDLHLTYLQTHLSRITLLEPTPACFMYTNYLLRMASIAPVEEAVASLLPCFWVYREVGRQMAALCHAHHPYQDWVKLYSSQEFDDSLQKAILIVNQLGEAGSNKMRENMVNAFVKSTKLEWLFWHSAYHQEQWLL